MKTRETLRWETVDAGGWQYVVPPMLSRRMLCYDTGAATLLLASLCRELVVLQPDPERRNGLLQQAAVLGLKNISAYSPDDLRPGKAWVAEGFDGFVIHDPGALVLNRGNHRLLYVLLGYLHGILRPGAFLYFGMRHRFGVDRLFAWRRSRQIRQSSPDLWSATALTRMLRSCGFGHVRRIPILLEQERVAELLAEEGYKSVKNRFLASERVKEVLLGQFGAHWIAPSYGLVASQGNPDSSFIEQLRLYLASHVLNDNEDHSSLTLKRCFVLNGGKVILSFGDRVEAQGRLIVVLTHDDVTARRREMEGNELRALARLPAGLSGRIPKLLHQCMFQGTHCFVLSELPGITIDAPAPRLWRITGNALQFLIELHKATRHDCLITDQNYPQLVGDLFDAARGRYPVFNSVLTSLETLIRQTVLGHSLPCVRFHGDYKIENVMVHERTGEITGVIDWELSRSPGLPMLDMIYLLVYNRMIHGSDWFAAFLEIALFPRRTPEEQKIWDRYLQNIHVPPGLVLALSILFVIHQIGYRLHLDLSRPGQESKMRDIIQTVTDVLRAAGDGRPEQPASQQQ